MRILFIGNSATYVHDIPETLAALATKAGHPLESVRIVKGGYRLSQHANSDTEHGIRVKDEIGKKYDVVVLQDNGDCVSSKDMLEASRRSCIKLTELAKENGSGVNYYVRPPYGYEAFGRSPLEQCRAFDEHFGGIAQETGAICTYVNRAFAYAMKNLSYRLWGDDNGHTSNHGAYLAVCVFYATIFGESSTVLAPHVLPDDDAKVLQEVADKIVLEGFCPWN